MTAPHKLSVIEGGVGPLSAPAVAATLISRGLKIYSARRKNLYDKRPSLVGLRTMFTIDFYDLDTKEPVSPSKVRVDLIAPDGTEACTVDLIENSGRDGYYTGSFIPEISGEWKAIVRYGTRDDMIDRAKFYVLAV